VSEPGSAVAAVERATRVAYRRDGWLCVSAEDGTGEIRVAESAGGVFSLSPDGRTLAFVDGESRLLVLTDVAARLTVSVGAALAERPSWSPDSAWLVYTAPGPVVVRISRNGSGATRLFDGRLPAVATSGGVVVGTVPGDGPREIVVWRADRVARASVDANVSALACDGSTVYFGAGLPHVGAATLRAVGIAGSDARVLVGASVATRVVAISDLVLSPDGRTLVYAEHGDDGYSRAFLLPATGGTPVALSSRRDCYPLQWSADGRSLFLIEGNAFQGETTALVRAPSDGSTRRRIVGGAGL
jgi:Tol biopolymer transport system component